MKDKKGVIAECEPTNYLFSHSRSCKGCNYCKPMKPTEEKGKKIGVMFSSQRDNWKTPQGFYKALDSEFNFDHDPCPSKPKEDGLISSWGGCSFVNPPYSDISNWMKKGFEEWKKGKTIVFLIPSRTDTRWWHEYCMKATEIRFIKGRLKFDDQKNSAPFPSALVIFKSL